MIPPVDTPKMPRASTPVVSAHTPERKGSASSTWMRRPIGKSGIDDLTLSPIDASLRMTAPSDPASTGVRATFATPAPPRGRSAAGASFSEDGARSALAEIPSSRPVQPLNYVATVRSRVRSPYSSFQSDDRFLSVLACSQAEREALTGVDCWECEKVSSILRL